MDQRSINIRVAIPEEGDTDGGETSEGAKDKESARTIDHEMKSGGIITSHGPPANNILQRKQITDVDDVTNRKIAADKGRKQDPSGSSVGFANPAFDGKVAERNSIGLEIESELCLAPIGVLADAENQDEKNKGVELSKEDATWLTWVTKQFITIAGEDQQIDMDEFKTALGVKKSFFAERFFMLFDEDGGGTIDLSEMMAGLVKLTRGTPKDKLKFLFDVYDVDGSGEIDADELKTVLSSCMEESSLKLSDEVLEKLTLALFESADKDNSGDISFEELVVELERHPGVMDNLTMSAASWLKPPSTKKKSWRIPGAEYFTKSYIVNNMRWLSTITTYFSINVALFVINAYRYRKFNWCVVIARGCGMCLNFNCTFIVTLMFRYLISWMRTTRAALILPLDNNVYMHKLVGFAIAFFSFVHTVAHLGNLAIITTKAEPDVSTTPPNWTEVTANATSSSWPSSESMTSSTITQSPLTPDLNLAYWEFLFTLRSRVGWIGPGFGFLSGVILDVILIIMVVCSMPFVRRGGYFQVFYWTHFLYFVFWIILILHAPLFIYFFALPGLVFLVEKVFRSRFMKRAKYGKMYITEATLLPSKVTHLVISRPENLRYKPGDYIFINIPAIASQEWHPFTISSAPEMKDSIWLHIRAVGHWTSKLYEFFEGIELTNNACSIENGHGQVATTSQGDKTGKTISCQVKVAFDGPFGTPTREIFETEHAVLIGSGIGVTPFASILQSIMHRFHASRIDCPKCQHHWFGDIPEDIMKLKKVDFIWINRSQNSFEWFLSLLSSLEDQQDENEDLFLEMQNFMTAAAAKNEMKGMGLQMALDIVYDKTGRDVITGLKTKTHPGRPNWHKVFSKVDATKKGKVKVFFCGSPILAKTLKYHCEQFNFTFCKESF